MPQREPQGKPYSEISRLRKKLESQKNEEWYCSLTSRDLYEMETQSLMNQTVIDRPIQLAMSNVTITLSSGAGTAKDEQKEELKSIDPEAIMTDCMVDGRVILKVRTSWTDLEIEDNDTVKELRIDGEGKIEFLRFQYQTTLENGKPGPFFRRDYSKVKVMRPNLQGEDYEDNIEEQEVTISVKIDYPLVKRETDFDKLAPDEIVIEEIPYIPFVAQTWNKDQVGFLTKKKNALLELERVTIEIGGENNKHSRRKLFIKAPALVELELGDLHSEINTLDKDGDAFYPDPHAAVIEGFFKEQQKAIEAIENATGVVATEKIVALSGVSRIIAMKSLVDLSHKIQKKFINLMILLEDLFREYNIDSRQITVFTPPLGVMITDVTNQAVLLTEALAKGYISDYEARESTRQMLSL